MLRHPDQWRRQYGVDRAAACRLAEATFQVVQVPSYVSETERGKYIRGTPSRSVRQPCTNFFWWLTTLPGALIGRRGEYPTLFSALDIISVLFSTFSLGTPTFAPLIIFYGCAT